MRWALVSFSPNRDWLEDECGRRTDGRTDRRVMDTEKFVLRQQQPERIINQFGRAAKSGT